MLVLKWLFGLFQQDSIFLILLPRLIRKWKKKYANPSHYSWVKSSQLIFKLFEWGRWMKDHRRFFRQERTNKLSKKQQMIVNLLILRLNFIRSLNKQKNVLELLWSSKVHCWLCEISIIKRYISRNLCLMDCLSSSWLSDFEQMSYTCSSLNNN